MSKDFTSNINDSTPNIDGNNISQTYDEREIIKQNTEISAKQQLFNEIIEGTIKSSSIKKDKRSRVSLYMDEELYDRISLYAALNRTNMNKMITDILAKNITPEKIKKAFNKLSIKSDLT